MGRKKAEYEWERKKGESSESYAAFKLYYQMGDKRSCAKVAKNLGRSNTLISGWCSKWDWVERARAYDNELARQEFAEACNAIKKMNEQQAQIGLLIQKKALEALKEMKSKELYPKLLLQYLVQGAGLERKARDSDVEIKTGNKEKEINETDYADDGLTEALRNSAKKVWDE
nr:MAG TPA: hypothetical protein [Caudoviricetes sp.]